MENRLAQPWARLQKVQVASPKILQQGGRVSRKTDNSGVCMRSVAPPSNYDVPTEYSVTRII